MKKHWGYTTQRGKGAKCSKCDEWIEPGEDAVLMKPVTVTENGGVSKEATAFHGLLHLSCFENL